MPDADNENKRWQNQQGGPLIDQDKRVTKPYSKRILFFGILLIGAVILAIAVQSKSNLELKNTEVVRTYDAPKRDFASMAAELQASARKPAPPAPPEIREVTVNVPEEKSIFQEAAPPPPRRPRYFSNQEDRQAANQLKMMNTQAIMNPPKVDGFGDEVSIANTGTQQQTQQNLLGGVDPSLINALIQQQQVGSDPNRQTQKADFLRNGGAALTRQGYSENVPIPQQFYLELKAGTVIPGILMTGVNSDLPGTVMGQVSENVWDTSYGRYVLIPKGTKILGVYDSHVTYGQKRVLVVWNRLIFPNGTSLNISGSPGLDQSGYAGMRGKVDEHWGRLITAALLASLFVTGAEIISPRDNRNNYSQAKTPGEIAGEQAANAILDMSSKIMSKNMDIQPTITIRPGRRFNIFVEKDVVFPEPYPIGL